MTKYIALASIFLTSIVQTVAQGVFKNHVFDPDIKTLQLYPQNTHDYPGLEPSVINLNSDNLVLEFDDLSGSYRQFHVHIVHCDENWEESSLSDLQFLSNYNDFIINDYLVAQGTKVKYYHYGFLVPNVTIGGNFILELRDGDVSGPLLAQQRFYVVDAGVNIVASARRSSDPVYFRTHQELSLEINYGNYPLRDPMREFTVYIRKNYDDNNLKEGLRPMGLNAASRTIQYRFFDNEHMFKAGNEWRIMDIRSNFNKGRNIEEIEQGFFDELNLVPQRFRSDMTYLNANDLNGRYFIETLDGQNAATNADYVTVNYFLKSLEFKPSDKVCILGLFNNFSCTQANSMLYDYNLGGYTGSVLLKQGIYDFQFGISGEDGKVDYSLIEGDFSPADNTYEVFVYHKPPTARAAVLVGYRKINSN